MKSRRLAVIPARGGSKRIKDKNIIGFMGKPMIWYSLKAARNSRLFDTIHVSTDSSRIAAVAGRLGFPVDFMREPELSGDRAPLMAVLRWTLQEYARRGQTYTEVCLLMATAPLLDAADLVAAQRVFARHPGRSQVIGVSPMAVPVEWALDREADGRVAFRQSGASSIRSQDLRRAYFDTGLFAFFDAAEILEPPVRPGPVFSHLLPRSKAVDIDEPEDLELAKVLFRGRQRRAKA